MTILSNTRYKWRLDIIRDHIKIGEAKLKSCTVDFVEDSEVTRTMKAEVPVNGFVVNDIMIQQPPEYIFFDGTRCFDGTWCFVSITGKWQKIKSEFSMFSDRLRPVMVIDDKEYNFGDFVVIAAPMSRDGKEFVYDVEAYDETMILKQCCLTSRKYYEAGTTYISIIGSLIQECNLTKFFQVDNTLRTTIDHEYAIGTSYLSIINGLLEEINYYPIYAGESGYLYLTPKEQKYTVDFSYTEKNSSIIGSISLDTDIYSLPNTIVGYISSPDIPDPIMYKRVNDNPKSLISTVSRGYSVVQSFHFNDCPDATTLQGIIDNKFLELSQATESADIETMPDGNHPYGSQILLNYEDNNIVFREKEWSISFGGTMTHKLERKVYV